MKRKQKKSKKMLPILLLGGVILLALILLISKFLQPDHSKEIDAGISYLKSLEEQDPAAVQQIRKEIRADKLRAERDEILQQLDSGELDPYSLFQDYVLMGDSRAVGFEFWEFLDPNRVLANSGDTILAIEEQFDTLVDLNPSMIFLCYGINDVSIGIWSTPEEYAASYMETIDKIQEKLPDATIVISSILPAKDPAFSRESSWYRIPDWNVVLKETCAEHGVLFADCSDIAATYFDLWDPDGIHVQTAFYPHWGRCLIETVLKDDAYVTEEA